MTAAVPVRTARGPLHLARSTGRGYRTACGRTLTGAGLEVPRRPWARAWALEPGCAGCDRRRQQARSESDLARLAGWV